jgi:tetratricopeptide (TPR) repeat protein
MAKREGKAAKAFPDCRGGLWRAGRLGLFPFALLTLFSGAASAKAPRDNGEAPPPKVVPGQKVTEAYLDLGRKKMEAGDLPGAIAAFDKAHEASPKDPWPVYYRGEVHQHQNKLAEAEADFRQALLLDPKHTDARAQLGDILTDSGRAAEAVDQLELVVKARPDFFEAQYNLGVANEALSRWSQAAEAYRKAAQLRPRDPDVRLNLAAALRHDGQLPEALAAAREAAQLAPDDAVAHMNLGLLLSDSKRFDEAVTELTAATRLKPDLHKAWWLLGVVQLRRHDVPSALEALEHARAIKATPEVLTDLGLARRQKGDLRGAEDAFREALATDPRYQPARIDLAWFLATTKRCKEAQKELLLVPRDPQFTESVNRVKAECQYEKGQKK